MTIVSTLPPTLLTALPAVSQSPLYLIPKWLLIYGALLTWPTHRKTNICQFAHLAASVQHLPPNSATQCLWILKLPHCFGNMSLISRIKMMLVISSFYPATQFLSDCQPESINPPSPANLLHDNDHLVGPQDAALLWSNLDDGNSDTNMNVDR